MDPLALDCSWYRTAELDWPRPGRRWPPPVEGERSHQRDADGRVTEADSQFLDGNQDDCCEKKKTRHRKSSGHCREGLSKRVHSRAPFALARRGHRQSDLSPCRARGNRLGASPLPGLFGLFAVDARWSSFGFEAEQDLAAGARWLLFRRLEPALSDWQQPNIARMLQQPGRVSSPLDNDFRSF